jgi:hypothetical protein
MSGDLIHWGFEGGQEFSGFYFPPLPRLGTSVAKDDSQEIDEARK